MYNLTALAEKCKKYAVLMGDTLMLKEATNNKIMFSGESAYVFIENPIGSHVFNFNSMLSEVFDGHYIAFFGKMAGGYAHLEHRIARCKYEKVPEVAPGMWCIGPIAKDPDSFEAMLGIL